MGELQVARAVPTAMGTVLVALLLAACGGGGSGPGPTPIPTEAPRVVVNPANAPTLGAEALSTTAAGDVGSNVVGLFGVQVSSDPGRPAPMRALVSVTRKALDARLPVLVTGASINLNVPCSGGGTLAVSGTVADPNRDTAGDSLSVAFANCIEGPDRVNGALTLRLASVNSAQTFYEIDLIATGFTSVAGSLGERLDGSLRLTLDDRSPGVKLVAVTSSVLTLQQLVNGTVRTSRSLIGFDYDLSIATATGLVTETVGFTATGEFPGLGAVSFTLATAAPIVSASVLADRPSSGALVVTGASGRSVRVTVLPGGAQFDVDHTGDASYDLSTSLTWQQIDALIGA